MPVLLQLTAETHVGGRTQRSHPWTALQGLRHKDPVRPRNHWESAQDWGVLPVREWPAEGQGHPTRGQDRKWRNQMEVLCQTQGQENNTSLQWVAEG